MAAVFVVYIMAGLLERKPQKVDNRKCFYFLYLLLYPELHQMAFYGAGEEIKGKK